MSQYLSASYIILIMSVVKLFTKQDTPVCFHSFLSSFYFSYKVSTLESSDSGIKLLKPCLECGWVHKAAVYML